MNIFKRKNSSKGTDKTSNQAAMSEMALKTIHDGVVIANKSGVVKYINPAAATMTGYGSGDKAIGLDYGLVIRLESKEGRELSDNENPLIQSFKTGQPLEGYQGSLVVNQSDKRVPVAVSVLPPEGMNQDYIITFRNITRELEEEGEQTEFISTASHEMRTPVATIDGYLSLSLNPQTATIDERARGYLTAAQNASKHLGKLFQDLLDVTKLDDNRIKPHFVPQEMVSLVQSIVDGHAERAKAAKIDLKFGSSEPASFGESRRVEQIAYGFVDVDFVHEIIDNLIDNALKYTPAGGSVYANVRGDGDRVLINVTDTGMGISPDDLGHIFQKFYRVDNSDTRTIGGTGLGLYLVKQRVEAMGGRVWAESAFGEGSTFYVSLPRLTQEEYDKRMIVVHNQEIQKQLESQPAPTPAASSSAQPASANPAPTPQPALAPTAPTAQPAPAPAAVSSPSATPAPQVAVPSAPAPQPTILVSQPASAPTAPAPQLAPAPATPSPASTSPPIAQPVPPPGDTPKPSPTPKPKQIDINLNGEHK